MGKRCRASTGFRDWTKEEIMAYLDWSESEDGRINDQVELEIKDKPLDTGRRGMASLWEQAGRIVAERDLLSGADL
jgi:hypothetical protein